MDRQESVYSLIGLIGIAAAALFAAFVLGSDGTTISLAQSPLPTPTFTTTPAPPAPTFTPIPPTPTFTPVPPTPTFTPVPPTPTFTPIPPTPTFTPVPPTSTPTPNLPPTCTTASPSIDTLWPPNHQFVKVDLLDVTDPEGDPIAITIDNIFQDEPVDTKGDGSFTPDGHGVGTSTAGVRAERAGTGDGRVYHIRFTANDAYGGSCSDEVLVGVPKSQGREGGPIDGGALFDSTVAAW